MTNIATKSTFRNPVTYYASLEGVEGQAALTSGGYVFRADDSGTRTLVDFRNSDLCLYGRKDIADGQYALDTAHGGLVTTCSRTVRS